MKYACDEMAAMLSGYVDGELSDADRGRVEAHVGSCNDCRRELEDMRGLANVTAQAVSRLQAPPPADEVWDTFLDNVYNRIERRTGWIVFVFGVAALSLFGLYHFVVDPWASPTIKTMVALPGAGMLVLFGSVLRQRMVIARTDRYSRDIRR